MTVTPYATSPTKAKKLTGREIERAYVDNGYRVMTRRQATRRHHLGAEARRVRRYQTRTATADPRSNP